MNVKPLLVAIILGIIAAGVIGLFVLRFFCKEFNPDKPRYVKPKIFCRDLNLIEKFEKYYKLKF